MEKMKGQLSIIFYFVLSFFISFRLLHKNKQYCAMQGW